MRPVTPPRHASLQPAEAGDCEVRVGDSVPSYLKQWFMPRSVVLEHSTEPLTAFDRPRYLPDFLPRLNEFVLESLMVSFGL
jgi:hypothetical protein